MALPPVKIPIKADDKSKAAFGSAKRNMDKFRKSAFKLKAGLVALAGAAGLVTLIKNTLDFADSIDKAARHARLSTAELQKWQFIGNQSGVTINEMNKSLANFEKRMAKARAGTGALTGFLKLADPQFLKVLENTKSNSEALKLFTRRLGEVAPAARAGFIDAAFSSTRMLKVFGQTINEVGTLGAQFDRLGLVIDDKMIKKMAAAKDQLAIVGFQMKKLQVDIVGGMLPSINSFSQALIDNKQAIADGVAGIVKLISVIGRLVGAFAIVIGKAIQFYDIFSKNVTKFKNLSTGELTETRDRLLSVQKGLQKGLADNPGNKAFSASLANNRKEVNTLNERIKALLDTQIKQGRAAVNSGKSAGKSFMPPNFTQQAAAKAAAAAGKAAAAAEKAASSKAAAEAKRQADSLAKLKISQAAKIETIRTGLLTEKELLFLSLIEKEQIIRDNKAGQLISETEQNTLIEQLRAQHLKKLNTMERNSSNFGTRFMASTGLQRTKMITSQLARVTAIQANTSKKNFELNKKAGIANAIVGTAVAVTNALRDISPPPLAWAMAAISLAAGIAQIKAIKSTKFSGSGSVASASPGGSVGSGSGGEGVPSLPPQPQQQQATPPRIQLVLDDDQLFTGLAMRRIIDMLNEENKDGYVLET